MLKFQYCGQSIISFHIIQLYNITVQVLGIPTKQDNNAPVLLSVYKVLDQYLLSVLVVILVTRYHLRCYDSIQCIRVPTLAASSTPVLASILAQCLGHFLNYIYQNYINILIMLAYVQSSLCTTYLVLNTDICNAPCSWTWSSGARLFQRHIEMNL